MPARFGLKDLLFLVILLAIGVSVWLTMVQRDRLWLRLDEIQQKLVDLQRQTARLEAGMEAFLGGARPDVASGQGAGADAHSVPDTAPAAGSSRTAPSGAASNDASSGDDAAKVAGRDESWAWPGVPIAWQRPWSFATDPRLDPDYQPGGEFIEIFEGQPQTLMPFISTDAYARRIQERVCEPLGAFDPKTLEFRGVLAQAWQIAPDGRAIRVRLHPQARFSDGVPVTAEDVRWTFEEYVLNPQVDAGRQRATLDMVERVDVIDRHTVEIVFKDVVFTNLSYALGVFVLPKHFYEQFEPAVINRSTGLVMGSGPFRMASLAPDQEWKPPGDIVLVRNEQHWRTPSPLDRLRFKVVEGELTRLKAYEAGEGDMIQPSSIQFRLKEQDPGWADGTQMLEWFNMRSGFTFIAWQCGRRNGKLTPFHDRRVRQAMTMALDRERMIRDIWGGVGMVPSGPGASSSPVHNPQIKPWPYDLERARELLAEAGWTPRAGDGILRNEAGDPFVFAFTRPSGSEVSERIGAYVKDQCAKLGIRCVDTVVDWAAFADITRRRDFDALVMAWSPTAPESDLRQTYHSAAIGDQGDNFVQWANPDADRLIDAGRRELDDAKRWKIWHEFEEVLHDEQPYTFLRESPWLRFVRRGVGNVNTYRTGLEPWEFFIAGPMQASLPG